MGMDMQNQYFQQALSKFMIEFAAGNAIRALADQGRTVEEIHERLSFPLSCQAIGELVWGHYLDNGTICLQDPAGQSEKTVTSYEKVQNSYGKVSFQQVKKHVAISGEYVACDFGRQKYKDPAAFEQSLQALDPKDRDYVLGLPWPLEVVYHRKDERITRIMNRREA